MANKIITLGNKIVVTDDGCVQADCITFPTKSQMITMNIDGSNKQYRVLKNISGTVYEVLAMENTSDGQIFSDGGIFVYGGSALDAYLNSTYYNTITNSAKTAIVDKTFYQDAWYVDTSGSPVYTGYRGTYKPGSTSYSFSLCRSEVQDQLTRHIYTLSVQDVLDYILDTEVTDGQIQNYNIWKMLWDDESQHTTSADDLWLISQAIPYGNYAWGVRGNTGSFDAYRIDLGYGVRPVFQIDLSKIDWSYHELNN